MSDTPIYQQGRKDDTSGQGSPQYNHAAPSPSQDQPMNVAQAGPGSLRHPGYIQQKAALIQAAAKMAEDAASIAEKAAQMIRQAAEMVSQATNLPVEGQPSTAAALPFLRNTLEDTISGSSFVGPVRPLQQQQMDQPFESYQSQFSVASEAGPKRKRKARASSRREAGAGGAGDSIVAQAVPSDVSHNAPGQGSTNSHRLADYELQLKLIEEANKKRKGRQEKMLQLPHGEHESGGSGV